MNAVPRRPILSMVALSAIAAMIALLGLVVCPNSAYAVPRFDTAGTQVVVYYPNYEGFENTYRLYAPKGEYDLSMNLSKCKSTNKDVLFYSYIFSDSIEVEVQKAGTATLICIYKGDRYKVKYIVKEYVNPVKTLKIGKKNYAKMFKKLNCVLDYAYPFSGKLNIVPAKNWVLKKAQLTYLTKDGGLRTKTVKNGAKIKGVALSLTLKNKKTKAVETICLDDDAAMD